MVKISSARIDMEKARIDNALLKDYGEILVGGATGANTGAAFSIDLSAANMFNLILNAPVVDMAFINAGPSGTMCSFTVILKQDTVGGRKVSWPTTVLWDGGVTPTLTTTPGRLDILSFMTPDGGRKWFGFMGQQNITGLNLSTVTMWAWGNNSTSLGANPGGQLGIGDVAPRVIPSAINSDSWSMLAANNIGSFGLKPDGTLWAWGNNGNYGQLGINTANSTGKSSPTQIGTNTNWSSIGANGFNGFAIDTSNRLWSWGQGTSGQLGDNTVVNKSSPIQVGTLTNWASVGASGFGGTFGVALDTSNRLWSWGSNAYGNLGTNDVSTVASRSSPVQIGTLTNWTSQFSRGGVWTNAIKADGTLWSWGRNNGNSAGAIGNNTATVSFSSPVQIGTLTNWLSVSAGAYTVHAIKTDGTLWGWGANTSPSVASISGAIGNNTATVSFSSPVQIGTLTNWASVWSGNLHFMAIKTDGTLWAWGNNASGQLGTGDQNNRSSPTQIGQANTWTKIAGGGGHTIALKT